MSYDATADLRLLGCPQFESFSEIKQAYRCQARRLHEQLQVNWAEANERLANINAAYDRLKASILVPPHQDNSGRPPFGPIEIDLATQARLRQRLAACEFKSRFCANRDPASGVYQDPRRGRTAMHKESRGVIYVVAAHLKGKTLELRLSARPKIGNNILAVPEMKITQDGELEVGENISLLEFSVSQIAPRVRIDRSRLPHVKRVLDDCLLVFS